MIVSKCFSVGLSFFLLSELQCRDLSSLDAVSLGFEALFVSLKSFSTSES